MTSFVITRRRAVSRRFDSGGALTYLFLILVFAASIFPLYWSLVVASHTNAAVYEYPPKLLPGSNLFHNIHRLFNAGVVNVDFAKALTNSAIVATCRDGWTTMTCGMVATSEIEVKSLTGSYGRFGLSAGLIPCVVVAPSRIV